MQYALHLNISKYACYSAYYFSKTVCNTLHNMHTIQIFLTILDVKHTILIKYYVKRYAYYLYKIVHDIVCIVHTIYISLNILYMLCTFTK